MFFFLLGIPKLLFSGQFSGSTYLALELLGPSLKHLVLESPTDFSMNTVIQIGMQVIDCLQEVHDTGFIHQDLKLQNLAIGRSD